MVRDNRKRYYRPEAAIDIALAEDDSTRLAYLDLWEEGFTPSEIDYRRGWPSGTARKLLSKLWLADREKAQRTRMRADDPDRLPSVMSLAPFEREDILRRILDKGETSNALAEEYGVDLISLRNWVGRKKRQAEDADAV